MTTKDATSHTLLRKARENKGLSLEDLAGRLNIDVATVSRWERGVTVPRPYLRRQLYEFFGLNAQDLGFLQENHEDTTQMIQKAVEQVALADSTNIQEVAASQLAISNSYYLSGLQQSKQSFFWSLIFAGVGIGFFCLATGVILFRQPAELAYIGTIGGVVLELLAGTCLYLYKCATDQLATFRSGLTNMEMLLLANSMCEKLTDEKKQTTQIEVIRMIVASATQTNASGTTKNV